MDGRRAGTSASDAGAPFRNAEVAMVNYQLVDRRVRFKISLRNAKAAGLVLSSRLLSAAIRVETSSCWDDCRVISPTFTLRAIREFAGGCDFLKCDCEGAEWLIRPRDLSGIRRIEMELHLPPIGGPPAPALLDYIGREYLFEIERKPCHDVMGVMGILHAHLKDG